MIKNKKKVIYVALICILLVSMQSMGFAQGSKFKKTLEAWYNTASIVVNGTEMTSEVKPFIVDGTIYVPLRMMANIFDKDIQWDPVLQKALIKDKPNSNVQDLRNEIITKEIEITNLKKKIEELEAKVNVDIDDLEDQLNKDYDEYEDAEFEISLSGDEDDVTVKIEIDLDDYDDEWDDLDDDDIEDYLQDIVDDILDEYEDADIEGNIEDSSSNDDLIEFDVSRSGNVSLSADLDDLEDELDDECSDYFNDIDLSLKLDGDRDDIDFTIYLEYDDYDDEWDALSNSRIEDLMEDVFDEIEDEYEDADITGYIYDDDNNKYLYKYYKTSSGSSRFIEY